MKTRPVPEDYSLARPDGLGASVMASSAQLITHRSGSFALDLEQGVLPFKLPNRHEIRDTKPGTWATVLLSDVETLSELSRNGFCVVEMSGEVWTLRRGGDDATE